MEICTEGAKSSNQNRKYYITGYDFCKGQKNFLVIRLILATIICIFCRIFVVISGRQIRTFCFSLKNKGKG